METHRPGDQKRFSRLDVVQIPGQDSMIRQISSVNLAQPTSRCHSSIDRDLKRVQSAISVGSPCRGGLRGWPRPLCNWIDQASCDPQPVAHMVRLAAIRKSFPAERTYLVILRKRLSGTPASGIASAIRVSAILHAGQITENRQGRTRRADAQPLAGSQPSTSGLAFSLRLLRQTNHDCSNQGNRQMHFADQSRLLVQRDELLRSRLARWSNQYLQRLINPFVINDSNRCGDQCQATTSKQPFPQATFV